MSDPIERKESITVVKVAEILSEVLYHPDHLLRYDLARELIAKFTAQGIPVDKLLSGEAKVVSTEWLDEMEAGIKEAWNSPLVQEYVRKQAQHAGGQAVTPEDQ